VLRLELGDVRAGRARANTRRAQRGGRALGDQPKDARKLENGESVGVHAIERDDAAFNG
jgi:hypothetical protein